MNSCVLPISVGQTRCLLVGALRYLVCRERLSRRVIIRRAVRIPVTAFLTGASTRNLAVVIFELLTAAVQRADKEAPCQATVLAARGQWINAGPWQAARR